jgi:indolepyruvate ferredoxin oxidoreductase alpha subunit
LFLYFYPAFFRSIPQTLSPAPSLTVKWHFQGVSVIISEEICTLYGKSIKKTKVRPFYVSDKCKNHRNCISELACPAFLIEDEKVLINPNLCVGCAVCAQICPENAILPLKQEQA